MVKRPPVDSWREYVKDVIGLERQADVATKTGVDQATISRWLRGAGAGSRPPSMSLTAVRAFARAYRRPVVGALLAAGLLDEEEVDPATDPAVTDWRELVHDDELIDELARRLKRARQPS